MKKERKEEEKFESNILFSFYSNNFEVAYSEDEIIIDFMQAPPKKENVLDAVRIFFSPKNFKGLVEFLGEILEDYEKKYGKIESESKE